ncbi:MAG: hypothetical protein JO079_01765 [Frankiaceae bacterium]|nr:hypothetical protein [Frankiaceae bacterium]MBV9368443.1 hypothetical protein [Frankiales bacterium]
MTESLTTLRLPSRPLLAGGEARAIASGRRIVRRRRIAMTFAGAGSAAAVVAAVLVVGGTVSRGDSLSTVTPAGGSSGAHGTRGGGAGPRAVVAAPTPPPGVVPSPLPTPSGLPLGVDPAPSDSPSASPVSSATAPPAHGPYVGFEPAEADGGPTVTRTMSNDPTFCEKNTEVANYRHPDGWCMTLATTAPSQGYVAGHRMSFPLEMCKAPETGAATLHFPNRMEVNLSANQVLDDGNEAARWTWDNRFTFPSGGAHTLTFNAGDCATWVMTWSGQGYDGYAVPQGSYDVLGWLTASEYLSDNADYPAPVTNLRQGLAVDWS